MPKYPFPHDSPVHIVADEHSEIAYYVRDRNKYRRIRLLGYQEWKDTTEQPVSDDLFWFILACIERAKVR